MQTVGLRLAAGLVAAGLVLTGCGGSPEPSPAPKPSTSPSPSAPATPTPPAMPAAAKTKTRAGALSAVRYFLEALNYSGRVGDTTTLRNAYVPLCTKCEGIADGIDKTYEAGGSYRGGDWTAKRIKFYAINGDVAVLDATIDYSAQSWIKSEGAEPTQFKASPNNLHAFQLKWAPQAGWRVGALDPQQ
ncbi:MAG: hypothetical protein JWR90_1504 [Marmoricola sp.]|nr:hypothetical protein [Marmoricola sp.]